MSALIFKSHRTQYGALIVLILCLSSWLVSERNSLKITPNYSTTAPSSHGPPLRIKGLKHEKISEKPHPDINFWAADSPRLDLDDFLDALVSNKGATAQQKADGIYFQGQHFAKQGQLYELLTNLPKTEWSHAGVTTLLNTIGDLLSPQELVNVGQQLYHDEKSNPWGLHLFGAAAGNLAKLMKDSPLEAYKAWDAFTGLDTNLGKWGISNISNSQRFLKEIGPCKRCRIPLCWNTRKTESTVTQFFKKATMCQH
jgi:hypothetical protein